MPVGTAAAELSVNGGNAVTITAADTSTTGAASANQRKQHINVQNQIKYKHGKLLFPSP